MTTKGYLYYRFGEFTLQPKERRLLRGDTPVALTPKALELLELLVLKAGSIVSKEELLATLWPGRFVLESNLTKHIWFVRKALDDGGADGQFIETVSKAGYRFTAPVTEASSNDMPITVPPRTEGVPEVSILPSRRRHIATTIGVAFVFAAAALCAWWFGTAREKPFPWTAAAAGRTVAIFEFDNLSDNRHDAWIGAAFSEMLRTDVAQGGQLYLLPEEMVRAESRDAPKAAAFSPRTLENLRKRLTVDYVVTGSYITSLAAGEPYIRFDLAVQDARSGATLATFTRNGSPTDLPVLVNETGADLRKSLGIKTHSAFESKLVANAQPPTPDVMRRVGFAIDALHHYDPARAKDELLLAIVEAPDYAPAYVYLAKAWSHLGYKQKALATAKQAANHSANLPEFMRLQIEAQSYQAQFQWQNAIDTLRKLVKLQDKDPEPQLELANALTSASQVKEAQSVIDSLKTQGGALANDPRLELQYAQIAKAQDDTNATTMHAETALKLAQARGNKGPAAEAQTLLGIALTSSDKKAALRMLMAALENYRSVGNPSGEAGVHRDIGNVFLDTNVKRAREEYQKSLAQYQVIGDQGGVASAYADIGITLWSSGDKDGAETAVRNALQIRRETGDKVGEAWALAALAVEQSDDSASDESIANFRQAAAIDAATNQHSHRGFTLYSLSDTLRLRGEFSQAQSVCVEAQQEYANVHDVVNQALADFQCAQILLDMGDVEAASMALKKVYKAAVQRKDVMTLGNVFLTQAQVAMGDRQWLTAADLLGKATAQFKTGGMPTGEAIATSLLAQCDAALNNTAARNANIEHAKSLREGMTERLEIYQVDMALAELHGDIEKLKEIADDARQRKWPSWALEAQLSALHLLLAKNAVAAAMDLRAHIAIQAKKGGFGWILRRLP